MTRLLDEHSKRAEAYCAEFLSQAWGADTNSARSQRVALGRYSVNLVYRSEALERLFSPYLLSSPELNGSGSFADVVLWDPRAAAAPLPSLPWPVEAYRPCGEVKGYSDGASYIRFDVPMQAITVIGAGMHKGAYFNRSPDELPAYESAGPLKWLFHRLAVERGMFAAHCGAVSLANSAAVIIGPRGAGKSTTALACLSAGLDYLGDDRCLLEPGAIPMVHALYTRAKFFSTDRAKFGHGVVTDMAYRPERDFDGKLHVPVDQVAPRQMKRSARIGCFLVLERGSEEGSHLAPVARSTVARMLVSEVIGQSPTTAARTLALSSELVREAPVYTLVAGRNLQRLAGTIAEFLSRY